MSSLRVLIVVFASTLGILYLLDGRNQLPAQYTGTQETTTGKPRSRPKPPARWYALAGPFSVPRRDGLGVVRLTLAIKLPRRLDRALAEGVQRGRLSQEAVIRDVVTATVNRADPVTLAGPAGPRVVERRLLRQIRARTGVQIQDVAVGQLIVG